MVASIKTSNCWLRVSKCAELASSDKESVDPLVIIAFLGVHVHCTSMGYGEKRVVQYLVHEITLIESCN